MFYFKGGAVVKYFISDTHFGHLGILRFERSEFSSIEEHDDYLIDLIKGTLHPNDELWHLGDFGSCSDSLLEKWSSIKCAKKVLIRGNHDKSLGKLGLYFDEIHNTPVFLSKRILLSHEPYPTTSGTLNVHGHLHGSYLAYPNYLNISVAVCGYRLWKESDLVKRMSSLPKDDYSFLYEWYADGYVFKDGSSSHVVLSPNDSSIMLDASRRLMASQGKDYKEISSCFDFNAGVGISQSEFRVDLADYIVKCKLARVSPSLSGYLLKYPKYANNLK